MNYNMIKTNYVSFRIVLMHYTNIEYLRYLCKKLFKTNQGFLAENPFTKSMSNRPETCSQSKISPGERCNI